MVFFVSGSREKFAPEIIRGKWVTGLQ